MGEKNLLRGLTYHGYQVGIPIISSNIEWDLTNGPLSKLLELLDNYSGLGVRSVGPVGDFLEQSHIQKTAQENCTSSALFVAALNLPDWHFCTSSPAPARLSFADFFRRILTILRLYANACFCSGPFPKKNLEAKEWKLNVVTKNGENSVMPCKSYKSHTSFEHL